MNYYWEKYECGVFFLLTNSRSHAENNIKITVSLVTQFPFCRIFAQNYPGISLLLFSLLPLMLTTCIPFAKWSAAQGTQYNEMLTLLDYSWASDTNGLLTLIFIFCSRIQPNSFIVVVLATFGLPQSVTVFVLILKLFMCFGQLFCWVFLNDFRSLYKSASWSGSYFNICISWVFVFV